MKGSRETELNNYLRHQDDEEIYDREHLNASLEDDARFRDVDQETIYHVRDGGKHHKEGIEINQSKD